MPGVADVQAVLREALEEDYAKGFAPRFAWASRVRKREVPVPAIDELRNGLDHFARAMLLATANESGGPPPSIDGEPLSGDPMVDAARGLRHIVAAEFFCLYYIATWRLDDINAMLASALLEHLSDPTKEEDERDRCIDALAGIEPPRPTTGALTEQEVERETDRTAEVLDQITDVAVKISELWRRLTRESKRARLR
jgi:hypothetical protein